MPVIREKLDAGCRVTFDPKGTSMRPMLRQGIDRIEIAPVKGRLRKYDLPFYQRDDGQYVLHRIVRVEDTYTCIGDNQYVYEPGIRHDQVIAVASGFYRGEKYISTRALSYRVYCRLWHWGRPLRLFRMRVRNKLRRMFASK